MNAVISASGLSKRYGNQLALDGISFEIPAGRIVGLIGPNGAGKTTALKAILGLIPFEGELNVLGLDPRTQRDELMKRRLLHRRRRGAAALDARAAMRSTSSPACIRASTAPSAERFLASTKLKPAHEGQARCPRA